MRVINDVQEGIMNNQDINLTLEKRKILGKKVKHLRKQGIVPAVIHDHGKESMHVSVQYLKMTKIYSEAGKHHPINLVIDDKKFLALIRDVHFEPKKNRLQHVVFNAIKQNEKVEAEIPIKLSEDIPAEKASLIVLTHLEHVDVEGLPKDLIDEIIIDASKLKEVGDKLVISDIKIPTGLIIKNDQDFVIATVEIPKDQIAEANATSSEITNEANSLELEKEKESETSSEK